MSNHTRTFAISCFLLASLGAPALRSARAEAPTPAPAIYVETDPAAFGFGGWSGHLRVAAPGHAAWTIGAGAYALDLPQLMIDLDPANRDEGWSGRIRIGYGGFVDRFLGQPGRGWFAGAQIAAHHLEVTRDGGAARAVALLAMPRVGYHWRPWSSVGLYVAGWFGLGVRRVIAGDTDVAGEPFRVSPVVPYGAVHVGWSF